MRPFNLILYEKLTSRFTSLQISSQVVQLKKNSFHSLTNVTNGNGYRSQLYGLN